MRLRLLGTAALTSTLLACAPGTEDIDDDVLDEEETASESRDIINGSLASDYPEAVLVNIKQGSYTVSICSGAVIAPRVVLTAGHCVYGSNKWEIVAPFAQNQKANGTSSATYDWNNDSEYVDPNQHDVGLIFLDKDIWLSTYPKVSTTKLAWGSKIQNIGRILNGQASYTKLYKSPQVAAQNGSNYGFPYDYYSQETIQSGDSGGPVVAPGTHTIYAVNSGSGGGTQVLARTDLVSTWIQQQIAAHPGGAPTQPADPCNGITYAGACQTGKVVWCENNALQSISCGAQGKTCGWDSQNSYYNCM